MNHSNNKYYSQYGEDKIIEKYFQKKNIINGTFFEMGAGDGIQYSNTKFFSDNGWSGLLVECDDVQYQKLKKNYEKNQDIIVANEKCSKENDLNFIFKKYNLKNLDLLSLDIDGLDLTILKLLDFKNFKPKIIIIEYNIYIPNDVEYEDEKNTGNLSSAFAIKKFLNNCNYKLVNCTFANLIFMEEKFDKEIIPIGLEKINENLNPLRLGINNNGKILLFSNNTELNKEFFKLPTQKKFIISQPIPRFLRKKNYHHSQRFLKSFYSHLFFLIKSPILFLKYLKDKIKF